MAFESSGLEILVQPSLALSGKRATLSSRDVSRRLSAEAGVPGCRTQVLTVPR